MIWQQVLKRLDLSVAFANKGITIIWGILWGILLFGEKITFGMVIGAIIVIAGIVVTCAIAVRAKTDKSKSVIFFIVVIYFACFYNSSAKLVKYFDICKYINNYWMIPPPTSNPSL